MLVSPLKPFLLALAMLAPPRVVEFVPPTGSVDVDPELAELRVTFDQDMSTRSFSWTGGGPSFPRTTGQPRWIDARTCALPVALVPGRAYALGINGGSFTGFRNRGGEPAAPAELWFRTAGGEPIPALAPAQNAEALEELRRAIDDDYSHRDLAGLDWDALVAEHRATLLAADNPYAFAIAARDMLAATGDAHVSVLAGGGARFGVPAPPVEANFDGRVVSALVPELGRRSRAVVTGRFEDGIRYVLVQTWSRDEAHELAVLDEVAEELAGAPGVIVDVRPNGGGDETIAQRFAGRFVDGPTPYAKHRFRADGAWSDETARVLEPVPPALTMPVCVLIGPACMSSNEAFVLMLRAAGATLVGAPTRGSTGNPKPHALSNGVTVLLPSWLATDLDGDAIEGAGIEPDVHAPPPAAGEDPALAAALRHLRGAGE